MGLFYNLPAATARQRAAELLDHLGLTEVAAVTAPRAPCPGASGASSSTWPGRW